MVFKRKLYDKMLEWKYESNGKTALMIDGARRVGKSTIAEEFASNEYDRYLLIDFGTANKDVQSVFTDDIGDIDTFFRNLFLFTGCDMLPIRKSVIILDEIQLFPPARQAIKYLVKDGRYDYIETGSLISIKRRSKEILIPSEEYKVKMFPMDFEEFLWANGDFVTANAIREAFAMKKPMGDRAHRAIIKTFRTYLAVGGMPQAVDLFVQGGTYKQIDIIKRSILDLYEEDLKKNDNDNRINASAIFRTIPQQLSNKNAMFRLSLVGKNAKFANYIKSVRFIEESMIGNYARNVTNPEITLELFAEDNNFKLFMGDTGLLVTQILKTSAEAEDELYRKIIAGTLGANLGSIFENMAAQMLRANGHDLYFHEYRFRPIGNAVEQKYEIDFLLVRNNHICPVEVKSSSYTSHSSFDMFIRKYNIKIDERFIIYTKDLKVDGNIVFLPIYMAMCL